MPIIVGYQTSIKDVSIINMIGTSTTSQTTTIPRIISDEDLQRISNRIKAENRELKIESILEDKEYIPKKIDDDDEYRKSWSYYPGKKGSRG